MTLRTYLITMAIATLLSWSIFVFVLFAINPLTTNYIGFVLFYVSLFISLVGTTALLGFFIRFVAMRQELAFRHVAEAFRQSFLFSALVVASLFLFAQHLFTWLNLLLLAFGLSVLEFFFISYKKPIS